MRPASSWREAGSGWSGSDDVGSAGGADLGGRLGRGGEEAEVMLLLWILLFRLGTAVGGDVEQRR
jgi:hypothetical protein